MDSARYGGPVTDSDYTPPATFGRDRYVVEAVLGTGGTATVLRARDRRIGVARAIKVLHAQFAMNAETRRRFMNEAHAQAALSHPGVLMVHDAIDDEQGVYLVMELADRGALGSLVLEHGTLDAPSVADIGIQVGEALAVAHRAGLVHRDIKPANILIDRHGGLKLADFGIARVTTSDHTLTRTGSVIGTWAFMPPEQRQDSTQVDHRSDIYAFGVTLYAVLTGRSPNGLHNREAWDRAYAGVPGGLAAILQRATRLFQDDRYDCMEDMIAELKAWRSSDEGAGPGWLEALHTRSGPTSAVQADLHTDLSAGATAVPEQFYEPSTRPAPAMPGASSTIGLPAEDAEAPPSEAPPSGAKALLLTIAGGTLVVSLLLGVIIALLIRPDPTPAPAPGRTEVSAPAPSPTTTAPEAGTATPSTEPNSTEPAPAEPDSTADTRPLPTEAAPAASKSAPPEKKPKRRVIQVIEPEASSGPAPSAAPDDTPAETGTLVVRTIPSGGTVTVAGRTPPRSGGGYTLPIGNHTVELRGPGGETHRVPVAIRRGKTVDICYSFDANAACGGSP